MHRTILATVALVLFTLVPATAASHAVPAEPVHSTRILRTQIDWDLVVRVFNSEQECLGSTRAYQRPGTVPMCVPHQTSNGATVWLLLLYHI
ncbi:hypothetical protein ACFVMC_13930 [Nocardia sp. NPDC127579]|uniref:hypothetical protein n=1 Tax=Nocardia sp. NPDC127579 TaxID=3345402 RepID=UPI00362ADC85